MREGGSKTPVFVREATGLVREISIRDSFFANLAFINIALGVLTYTSAPYVFPGSNVVQATLIATALSLFVSLMYTLFTWAMPRTGGDYIWTSRVLNPAIGFIANFNVTFWYIFFIGVTTNWLTTLAISPSLLAVGTVTSSQSLINVANTLSKPLNVTIIGIIVIIAMALIMIRGVRTTFTINNVLFIISIIGVVIMVYLLLTNSHANFVNDFNKFANYDNVTATAHAAGYSPVGSNTLNATLGIMPFIFASTAFGIVTSYFSGEVKSVKKNALYSQVLATAVGGVMLTILGGLAVTVFGYDFLGSITSLSSTGNSAYPFSFPPFFNLFVSMLTSNPILLWILAISYVAAIMVAFLPTYMIGTRNIFAWSFDRAIATRFSEVHERFHSPVYAVIAVAILQFIGLIAYTYGPPAFLSLVSGAGLAENITFIIVCIAAIIFPFKLRDMYKSSAANINLGPIPLISVAGIVALASYLLQQYYYLANPLYGADVPNVYEATAVSIILPIVIFVVSYYNNARKGIKITLAYKSLPPE